MNNSNQEYINRYWQKQLTDDERQTFEQKCAEEDDFAKEVALFLQLKKIATDTEKNRLKILYSSNKQANRNKILLAILVLTALGIFLLRPFVSSFSNSEEIEPAKEEERIFALLTTENQDAIRGDNDVTSTNYLKLYQEAKYDSLTTILDTFDLTKTANINELIWMCQSLYPQSNHDQIITLINAYLDNNPNDSTRKDELIWLQTLAHLKVKNTEKAKFNLELLIKEYRLYQSDAKNLLEALK